MWKFFRERLGKPSRSLVNRQHRRRNRPALAVEQLEGRDLLAVTFHGGQLLPHVEAQAVYLGSDWASTASLSTQTAAVDQYLSYLVQSPYMTMLTQAGYNVGQGTATAGKTLNLSLSKSSGITDAQIRADLQTAITSSQLSAPDANRLYVVYVEPGVVIKDGTDTSANSFLGYHGAFAGKDAAGRAVDIRYAVISYPGTPNPTASSQGFSTSFDQLTSVTSHELAEAVTDPDVNYKTAGWYDDQQNGEIGDLTRVNTVLNNYVVQDVVNKNDQPIAPVATAVTLTAPQNVTAVAISSTEAQVSWNSAAGAAGYRVYLISNSQTTLVSTVGSSATSVHVTGLTPGSTARFLVEAFSATAVADSSMVSLVLPAAQQSLTAPRVSASVVSSSVVDLSWSSVPAAQGYRIYWWNGARAVLLSTMGSTATSARISGLAAGYTSYFIIEAFSGSAVADSPWISVTTPAPQRYLSGWFGAWF